MDASARETLGQSRAAATELTGVQMMLGSVSDAGGELSITTAEIASTMNSVNASAQGARDDLERAAALAAALGASSQKITDSVAATERIASQVRRVEDVAMGTSGSIEEIRAAAAGMDDVAHVLADQVAAFRY